MNDVAIDSRCLQQMLALMDRATNIHGSGAYPWTGDRALAVLEKALDVYEEELGKARLRYQELSKLK